MFTRPLIGAAVLVPIVLHADAYTVLLTERTAHLRDHAGQIGFPGGRIESSDDGPLAAALREAQEEIGLAAESIEVAGYLKPHAVVTGFVVTPVVGFVPSPLRLELDAVEVADAFEVPLSFFLDDANLRRALRTVRGVDVPLYEYRYGERRIWGATAHMLRSLSILINKNK